MPAAFSQNNVGKNEFFDRYYPNNQGSMVTQFVMEIKSNVSSGKIFLFDEADLFIVWKCLQHEFMVNITLSKSSPVMIRKRIIFLSVLPNELYNSFYLFFFGVLLEHFTS